MKDLNYTDDKEYGPYQNDYRISENQSARAVLARPSSASTNGPISRVPLIQMLKVFRMKADDRRAGNGEKYAEYESFRWMQFRNPRRT